MFSERRDTTLGVGFETSGPYFYDRRRSDTEEMLMLRARIMGLGSYVPERVVPNDEIPFLNERHERCAEQQTETNDAWIRELTGVEARRYVPADGSVSCSDLAVKASRCALADAGIEAKDIDCIIFATLSPDIHFPGSAVFLQTKLDIANKDGCACFDIRQQCSGFVYGLQMADAFVRLGTYRRVLLVGAELHSHSLEYSTRGRDVMVLFGDGAGAMVIGAAETDDARALVFCTRSSAPMARAPGTYTSRSSRSRRPRTSRMTPTTAKGNDPRHQPKHLESEDT
jgi:3-oxoacyl-[acyl-carrier-protein] synthase-3